MYSRFAAKFHTSLRDKYPVCIFDSTSKANLEDEDDDEYEDETSSDLCYHQPKPKICKLGAVYFSDHSRWFPGWIHVLA